MFNSPFVFAGVSLIAIALLALDNGCFGAGFPPVCVRKHRSYEFVVQAGLDARRPARPTSWIGTLFKPALHVPDGAGSARLRLAGVVTLEYPRRRTMSEASDPFGAPPHDEEPSAFEGACGS